MRACVPLMTALSSRLSISTSTGKEGEGGSRR